MERTQLANYLAIDWKIGHDVQGNLLNHVLHVCDLRVLGCLGAFRQLFLLVHVVYEASLSMQSLKRG